MTKEDKWGVMFQSNLDSQGLTPAAWLIKHNLTIEDVTDPVMIRFFTKYGITSPPS